MLPIHEFNCTHRSNPDAKSLIILSVCELLQGGTGAKRIRREHAAAAQQRRRVVDTWQIRKVFVTVGTVFVGTYCYYILYYINLIDT